MAPAVRAFGNDAVHLQMKDIVQNLYALVVQAYEHHGPQTQDAMKREIASLVRNLVKLSQDARNVDILLPPELIAYVESSRNPDVYTREFVEAVQRMNQMLKGRYEAYRTLRDDLAAEIIANIPELKDDVLKIVATTGDTLQT